MSATYVPNVQILSEITIFSKPSSCSFCCLNLTKYFCHLNLTKAWLFSASFKNDTKGVPSANKSHSKESLSSVRLWRVESEKVLQHPILWYHWRFHQMERRSMVVHSADCNVTLCFWWNFHILLEVPPAFSYWLCRSWRWQTFKFKKSSVIHVLVSVRHHHTCRALETLPPWPALLLNSYPRVRNLQTVYILAIKTWSWFLIKVCTLSSQYLVSKTKKMWQ